MVTALLALIRRHRNPGWIAIAADEDGNEVHVLPIRDLIDHTEDADCICGTTTEPCPRDDGSMAWLISHFSLDGREKWEQA